MRRAVLIRNPRAGGRDGQRLGGRLLASLGDRGFDIHEELTQFAGHATHLARQVVAQQSAEVVFACGGDGTLREVSEGLLGSDVALAVIPNGTTNVLARALGVPRNAEAAARRYSPDGPLELIDVGLCADRPFLMMVSGELDALALERTSRLLKRTLGKVAVLAGVVSALARGSLRGVDLDLGSRRQTATFFCVSNIPYYGGAFRIAPRARLTDGRLHLLLFTGNTRLRLLALAAAVLFQRHDRLRDAQLETVSRLTIDAAGKVAVQLDGDPMRLQTPLEIGLAEPKLKVLLPDTEAKGPRHG